MRGSILPMSTQHNTNDEQTINLTRRDVMRGAASAGAGAVTLHALDGGPLDPMGGARAIPPALLFVAGGAAIGYGVNEALNGGGNVAQQEMEQARAKETHAAIHEDNITIKSEAEGHLATYQEIPELVRDHIRTNATARVEQAVAAGLSKSETIKEVEDEIEKTVAGFQENHLAVRGKLIKQIDHNMQQASAQDSLSRSDVFDFDVTVIQGDNAKFPDDFLGSGAETVDLIDGTTMEVPTGSLNLSGSSYDRTKPFIAIDPNDTNYVGFEEDGKIISTPADNTAASTETIFENKPWIDVYEELQTIGNEELNNAAALTDQLYQPLKDGEIDSVQTASASEINEVAQNADNYNQQAATYRSLNVPEANAPAVIEVPGMKLEGILFSTVADRTLEIGSEYDPAKLPGSVEISAVIRDTDPTYGPGGVEPITVNLSVTRTDNSDPAALGTVEVQNSAAYEDIDGITTGTELDENGEGTLTLDGRTERTDITINHDGDTFEETIEHGGTDSTLSIDFEPGADSTVPSSPHSRQSTEVGSLISGKLRSPFVITSALQDVDQITFGNRDLIDPDNATPEETIAALEAAYDDRQQSTQNVSDLVDQLPSAGGGLFGGGGGPGLRQLALYAGAAILALFGLGQLSN